MEEEVVRVLAEIPEKHRTLFMVRRGVPKEAIRPMLGHHSWEFTAGTYVHLDDDDLPDGAVVGDLVAASAPALVAETAATGA
jgi:hypothetical protein